jgi:hypothetical protein
MNSKKHLTALATTVVFLAISASAAGGAQATPFDPGLPLNPVTQLPLSPMSQQNAVRKAEDYLDYTAFSRQGFAVDHITVDWNEQAAKKAEDYLDYTSFSRGGLIDQLEFDGFTPAQAQYGVAATGL